MMKIILYTMLAAGAINLAAIAQSTNAMNTNKIEAATLGGGCFWCRWWNAWWRSGRKA